MQKKKNPHTQHIQLEQQQWECVNDNDFWRRKGRGYHGLAQSGTFLSGWQWLETLSCSCAQHSLHCSTPPVLSRKQTVTRRRNSAGGGNLRRDSHSFRRRNRLGWPVPPESPRLLTAKGKKRLWGWKHSQTRGFPQRRLRNSPPRPLRMLKQELEEELPSRWLLSLVEWPGCSWSVAPPAPRPPPRLGHLRAAHSASAQIVPDAGWFAVKQTKGTVKDAEYIMLLTSSNTQSIQWAIIPQIYISGCLVSSLINYIN